MADADAMEAVGLADRAVGGMLPAGLRVHQRVPLPALGVSMRWASAVSRAARVEDAVLECSGRIQQELDGRAPDLVLVFPSRQHAAGYSRIPAALLDAVRPRLLVGCSGGGVIGGGREVEHGPGLSVTAALLPRVQAAPFRLEGEAPPGTDAAAWRALMGVPAEPTALVLLPDPLSTDAERMVKGLDAAFPRTTKIGGLASGGRAAGQHALFLDDEVLDAGAVGVSLTGDVAVETLVAQGCRPVGEPMFVTRCRDNVLLELDGNSPRKVLQALHGNLTPGDRELFERTLFLGIVMEPARSEYRAGDFLVRNVTGFDPATGALAVGARLQENQVVQFHVRDARTSSEDLHELLRRLPPEPRATGALLFSCLGRGEHLYGRADHDTDAFRRHLGPLPLGGFFCNGEIGPVGGKTFVHGYTSAFGLFRPRT
jgi:small ligand-binding sensory domain FIST